MLCARHRELDSEAPSLFSLPPLALASETGIVKIIVQFSQHDRFTVFFFKRKKRREPHQTPSFLPCLPSPLRVIPGEREGQEPGTSQPQVGPQTPGPSACCGACGWLTADRIHRQQRDLPFYFYPSYLKAARRVAFEVTATRKRRKRERRSRCHLQRWDDRFPFAWPLEVA